MSGGWTIGRLTSNDGKVTMKHSSGFLFPKQRNLNIQTPSMLLTMRSVVVYLVVNSVGGVLGFWRCANHLKRLKNESEEESSTEKAPQKKED